MERMWNRSILFAVLILGLGVLGAGCPPKGIYPVGVAVPQNNAEEYCSPDPDYGSGLYLSYQWKAGNPTAAGYQLYVILEGASQPVIDTFTTDTFYEDIACNTFVDEENLDGWRWSVTEIMPDGTEGKTTGDIYYSYEQCILESGLPCHAPAVVR